MEPVRVASWEPKEEMFQEGWLKGREVRTDVALCRAKVTDDAGESDFSGGVGWKPGWRRPEKEGWGGSGNRVNHLFGEV